MTTPAQEQTKKCSKCGEIKGVGEFYAHRNRDGWQGYCKTCHRKKQNEFRKSPKGQAYIGSPQYKLSREKWSKSSKGKISNRRSHLRKTYSITIEEWEILFSNQNNCCAICKNNKKTSKLGWVVDHNHITGVVRGILCNDCNQILGRAKDSPSLLRAAADYLEKWEKEE